MVPENDPIEQETTLADPVVEAAPVVEVEPVVEAVPVIEVEPEEYTPNHSFKIHGEELDFDDWAKGLAVDKASEDQMREVMTKFHGIDLVKEERERFRTDHKALQEKYETEQKTWNDRNQTLDMLGHYLEKKNFSAFFQAYKISDDDILGHAQKILNYQEMDPAQRQEHDQRNQHDVSSYQMQTQNDRLQQQNEQLQVQQVERDVEYELSDPNVRAVAEAFDQRTGRQGAFREEVWKRGQHHAMVNKEHISPKQAVDEVLNLVGGSRGPGTDLNPAPVGGQPTAANPQTTQTSAKPPVIPAIRGTGASPTAPAIKSIADIRAARQAKFG